jgi:SAM-dependent methyltransferase
LDEIARYNKERWEALSEAGVLFSRPMLDLDVSRAWHVADEEGVLRRAGIKVKDSKVLCLASGGGQQSVAFGLLGADVTVLDISETQLARDRQAAAHYGLTVNTHQGDMRDLSRYRDGSFDLVWHAFSINFVPSVSQVFDEATRVLRPGGIYRMMCHNPFTKGINEDSWTGEHYPLRGPYLDGVEIDWEDPEWVFQDEAGQKQNIPGPKEYLHTLSTVMNGLVERGHCLLGLWEHKTQDPEAPAGSWEHLKHIAPPWLTVWTSYRPEVMAAHTTSR